MVLFGLIWHPVVYRMGTLQDTQVPACRPILEVPERRSYAPFPDLM
ncbi:MAG: hypothetical protein ACOX1X_02075 [Dethiobacteria bacterium]